MRKHITIGIAGHTGHGKTSLVKCLTGRTGDEQPNDKSRQPTVTSDVRAYELSPEVRVAFIDVPGHAGYLKNAIRGLCAVDMAILVVAADDGIMPQTRAHLNILNHLNISHGLVVLSKADMVDAELLEFAELEVKDTLQHTVLDEKQVISYSAIDQTGREEVLEAIETIISELTPKPRQVPFRMWIDRIASFAGFGTVVCGTILAGGVKPDDALQLLPSGIDTKARTIEVHGEKVDRASAGQRVGINLPKIARKDITRGMALVARESAELYPYLNACLSANEKIANRQRVKLFIGTMVETVMLVMMDRDELNPGETGLVQLRLSSPLYARPRDTFIVTLLNAPVVIGGGTLLETTYRKFRKAVAKTELAYLNAVQSGDMADIVIALLEKRTGKLTCTHDITAYTGHDPEVLADCVASLADGGAIIMIDSHHFILPQTYDELEADILRILNDLLTRVPLKNALNKAEIERHLKRRTDPALLRHLLSEMCAKGSLRKANGGYTLPNPEGCLKKEQQLILERLRDYAREIGLLSFSAGSFCKNIDRSCDKSDIQQLLNYLNNQGDLIRLSNNHFICADVLDEIKCRVKNAIHQKGSIMLTDSATILGYGRAKGAPVFEYLDEIGFTYRDGNRRMLRE